MSVTAIPTYGGCAQGDTAANPNTIAIRDSSSGLAVAALTATAIALTGSLSWAAPTNKTSAFTADANAVGYTCDASGGAFNATLEAAASCPGRVHWFIRTSASNNVTIKGNGSENVNGANTYVLSAQYKWAMVVSDGTQWWAFGN